jgi:hypothetical protein
VGVSRILFHVAKSHNLRLLGILVRVMTAILPVRDRALRKAKQSQAMYRASLGKNRNPSYGPLFRSLARLEVSSTGASGARGASSRSPVARPFERQPRWV